MDRSRVMVLLVAILLPIGGLEARLVHLQLLTTTETTYDLANRRQSIEIVRPMRGPILDRLGRTITMDRSEEHTSELQSHSDLVCRLLLEKKKKKQKR